MKFLRSNFEGQIIFMIRTLSLYGLLSVLVVACSNASIKKEENTLVNANKQIVQRYFEEVWNKGNLQVLDSLLSPDYLNHTPSTPNPAPGPAGLKPIVQAIRRGFPDIHYEIQELIATDSFVVAQVIVTGTNTDSLFGLPPTGKPIRILQINEEKIIDGKISEHWRVTDELGMMKQLGVYQ